MRMQIPLPMMRMRIYLKTILALPTTLTENLGLYILFDVGIILEVLYWCITLCYVLIVQGLRNTCSTVWSIQKKLVSFRNWRLKSLRSRESWWTTLRRLSFIIIHSIGLCFYLALWSLVYGLMSFVEIKVIALRLVFFLLFFLGTAPEFGNGNLLITQPDKRNANWLRVEYMFGSSSSLSVSYGEDFQFTIFDIIFFNFYLYLLKYLLINYTRQKGANLIVKFKSRVCHVKL